MSEEETTPLMRQYREIKRGYPESILLFRVGDFYEMFYEDAQEASKLLSIALTSRDKSSADPVPLCGVPYHAAQGYIARLLKAGRTVALCEQVEDPEAGERSRASGSRSPLYTRHSGRYGIFGSRRVEFPRSCHPAATAHLRGSHAYGPGRLDVTTGDFWLTECGGRRADQLIDELARLEPTRTASLRNRTRS